MSETYERFGIAELDTISFVCSKCQTEIVFKLSTPTTFGVPSACPTCGEASVEIAQLFGKYRDLFAAASQLFGKVICFRVKTHEKDRQR